MVVPLSELTPLVPDCATRPIEESFNWQEWARGSGERTAYLVVFRSKRKPMADPVLLEAYDFGAYLGAQTVPGLIQYYRGLPDEDGHCVSFCFWERRDDAVHASRHPLHSSAVAIVDQVYEWFRLERYVIEMTDAPAGVRFNALTGCEHAHMHAG